MYFYTYICVYTHTHTYTLNSGRFLNTSLSVADKWTKKAIKYTRYQEHNEKTLFDIFKTLHLITTEYISSKYTRKIYQK